MKEFIEAIKSGDLVEAKKQFYSIMEDRTEALRQEMRVELAEAVRIEGETDEDDSEDDDDDKGGDDKGDDKDKKPSDKKDDDKDE
ncbi:prohead core protein [Citrobacter phage Margaery]|uniref:Prohead core protein n=2 Tax=Pseudotevenvirus margaery TaxID=2843955 RepID=A0A0M4RT23_9CAUD|nr:prohead [Citrobacter phage Margaery]ALF01905.1 prohead core protein [Citrobacter phage Margaery]AYJ73075.1 prohead core protein [Citrobacter phage Maroon]